MANYNVDIAVAVRNLDALKAFKRELTAVQRAVDDFNTKGLSVEEKKLKAIARKREDASLKALQRVAAADAKALEALAKKELELEDKVFKDKLQAIKDLQKAEEKATKDQIKQDDREFRNRLQARAKFDKKVEASAKLMIDGVKKVNEGAKELDNLQTQKEIKNDQIVFDQKLAKYKRATAIMIQDDKRRNKFDLDDFNDRLREKVRARRAADRKAAGGSSGSGGKKGPDFLNAALTAGAFPLLFGGGPGTAIGGALGGALTGQLFGGLTVVGQVVGGAVDAFVAKTSQLGQALNPLTADLEALIAASGNVNSNTSLLIKELEAADLSAAALMVATEELAILVGQDGVDALSEFGSDTVELGNEFNRAMTIMAAGVAGVVNSVGVLKGVADGLEKIVLRQQINKLIGSNTKSGERLRSTLRTDGPGQLSRFRGSQITEETFEMMRKINREGQDRVNQTARNLALNKDANAIEKAQFDLKKKGLDFTSKEFVEGKKQIALMEYRQEMDKINLALTNELLGGKDAELAKDRARVAEEEALLKLNTANFDIDQQATKAIEAKQKKEDAAAKRAAAEAKRLTEQAAKQLNQAETLEKQFSREVQLRTASSDVARDLLEIEFQHEDRIKQINELENQSLATQQKKNAEALKELQIRERLAAFATTKTEGEQSRDDINRENSLLAARLQGREKEFLLNERINELGGDFRNDLETQQDLQDRITGKEFAEQQQKQIGSLEAIINGTEEQFELQQKIQEIEDLNLTTGEAELIINQQKIADLEKQAELIQQQRQFYEQVGATIQSGIVNGIMSALDGSKSLSESLSGLLKQVGGMFLNVGIGALGQSMGIPGFKPFAQGGYVSSPTRALVGEGGQGEYIIPENRMRESMARYSRGARGSAVVPEAGASGTSGEGGGTAVAAPIDVRFNVERINNVDYVTAEQFQVGMQRAAQQGAAEGERRAMGSLRNSAAVRRRIGV